MNNDYCLQSYTNNDQGEGDGAKAGAKATATNWFQKTRIYKVITNPMFIVCLIIFIGFIVVIYCNYIRPRQFKTIFKKILHFAGFKYSHLTNQEREQEIKESREESPREATHNNSHNNSHFIIYGSSRSGKTSFLKHYLAQLPHNKTRDSSRDSSRTYVVFGRDERDFPSQNFVPLLQLEKVSIEQLANKTVILDDAGAYKSLRLKVEDRFRFGRHLGIQVIYLAHYAKDVLPIVRENCFKIYLTINNPDNFFESIVQTYAIKDAVNGLNWEYYRDQLEYGIIEFDTRSQKYKVLNNKDNLIYDSSKRSKWGPEQLVAYESYFFTGDEYNRLKIFLEEMSDQTIEITPLNIAYYFVAYCKQNNIKVIESKINNYVERMQQPLISDSVKEDFKKLIYDHAKNFTKVS